MEMTVVHKWQDMGIGQAPFCCVGMIVMPNAAKYGGNVAGFNNAAAEATEAARGYGVQLGTCNVCGTGLHNHYVIRDAAGQHFVVGCECVRKTGDSKLISEVEASERNRQREKRQARAEAKRKAEDEKRAAELDAQRQRNGGLTDRELQAKRREEEKASQANRYTDANGWLIDVLNRLSYSSDFTSNMVEKLHSNPLGSLPDRCVNILRDIYAKSHGRRGSKAYRQAEDEFDSKCC